MKQSNPTILLLGTCDSKLSELIYTKSTLQSQNTTVLLMDIGRNPTTSPEINITQEDILNKTPSKTPISSLPRDEYINSLTKPAIQTVTNLLKENTIHGILGIGGSCGTALATAIMQSIPLGFPKLMVSTMASGDIAPYIGSTDIAMMYSVVDIAGRNSLLEMALHNAACAIAGMSRGYMEQQTVSSLSSEKQKVRIGISMFGVTTPGVTKAKEHLEELFWSNCEIYIFHATGSGGRAMERLITEGRLDAVLDMTTTEIADEVVGGVLSAGDSRLCAGTLKGIPRVVSVGACDMVNFGPFESVPDVWRGRVLHRHNPTVTVMRTTEQECEKIGRLIVKNLLRGYDGEERIGNEVVQRTKVVLPVGGISMLDVPGQPFWNSDADEVLFRTIEEELKGSGIEVIRDPRDVNDPGFAVTVADMLCDLIRENR